MQLSLHTDYALRLLMALGATDTQMTIDEVATRFAISRNHLAKIVQDLQASGLIETTRGRGGGVRLSVDPAEVNIGTLVRRFERMDGFVACMGGKADCTVDGMCKLKPVLGGALEAFLMHLDKYTLADLLEGKRKQLRAMFEIA